MLAPGNSASSARISRTVVRSTARVTSCTWPDSSATGMNTSGPTASPFSRSQRASASAPVQRPLAISITGW